MRQGTAWSRAADARFDADLALLRSLRWRFGAGHAGAETGEYKRAQGLAHEAFLSPDRRRGGAQNPLRLSLHRSVNARAAPSMVLAMAPGMPLAMAVSASRRLL